MKKRFNNWVVSFLLASISFLIVPAEIVHHFFHHSDTEDIFFGEAGHFLEPMHSHCLILKVEIPEYVAYSEIRIIKDAFYQEVGTEEYSNPPLFEEPGSIELRGPPLYV
jgi:hypothetical protein